MTPIPPKQRKKPHKSQPTIVSADNVFDGFGYSMSDRLAQQKRTNRTQAEKTTVSLQHSARSDADDNGKKFIFRDVFPYRKYKLTFNTGQWLNLADASATVGYTLDGDFYQLLVITSRPEHRQVDVDLSSVPDIDTLEVRLVGAPEGIRGYLEDGTDLGALDDTIAEIQEAIEQIQEAIEDLDERVTALEDG